jgi:hypothetical protein
MRSARLSHSVYSQPSVWTSSNVPGQPQIVRGGVGGRGAPSAIGQRGPAWRSKPRRCHSPIAATHVKTP